MEAEVAKGFLQANNINAIIEADDAGGMLPFPVAYVSGVALRVSEKDLKKAQKVLKNV